MAIRYRDELKAMRQGWCKMYGLPDTHNELDVRRTGRTTGIALRAIGEAMTHPGTAYTVRNHMACGERPTNHMNKLAIQRVKELVRDLALEFFSFNEFDGSVMYNPPKWRDDVKV